MGEGGSKNPENVLTYYMDGFLVHNGFVFESNEDDCLTLKLGISKNDALIHEKVNILEELSIARNGLFFIGCNLDEKPLDPALLAFLRVLCFTKKEIDDFQGNHEKICSLSEPNTADGKFIFDTLVTQPMLQLRPNYTPLRSMDYYHQIFCRFQKCKQKVPPPSLLCNDFEKS